MAWLMRITEVTTEAAALDEDGQPVTIDLAKEGRFQATVEYFDEAAPAAVLHSQRFDFGPGTALSRALEAMKEAGRRVRDAADRAASLRTDLDTPIPID